MVIFLRGAKKEEARANEKIFIIILSYVQNYEGKRGKSLDQMYSKIYINWMEGLFRSTCFCWSYVPVQLSQCWCLCREWAPYGKL